MILEYWSYMVVGGVGVDGGDAVGSETLELEFHVVGDVILKIRAHGREVLDTQGYKSIEI